MSTNLKRRCHAGGKFKKTRGKHNMWGGGIHAWMVYFMENPNLKLAGGWSMSIITIDG